MRSTRRKTHYEILGVKPTASQDEIKQAFRRRAKRHHPDRNPGDPKAGAKFKRVNEANEVLSDPGKRRGYDLELSVQNDMPTPPPPPYTPPRGGSRPDAGSYEEWARERERRARRDEEAAHQSARGNAGSRPEPRTRTRSGVSAVWGLVVLVVFAIRIISNCAG